MFGNVLALIFVLVPLYFLVKSWASGIPHRKRTGIILRSIIGSIVCVLFVSLFFIPSNDNKYKKEPSFYDTGDIRDMNMKEYSDFLKWKDKQRRKEIEEQKIFK